MHPLIVGCTLINLWSSHFDRSGHFLQETLTFSDLIFSYLMYKYNSIQENKQLLFALNQCSTQLPSSRIRSISSSTAFFAGILRRTIFFSRYKVILSTPDPT